MHLFARAGASSSCFRRRCGSHIASGGDYSKFIERCEQDHRVIDALGAALEGSNCPLLAEECFDRQGPRLPSVAPRCQQRRC
jgi:hypothetical protein